VNARAPRRRPASRGRGLLIQYDLDGFRAILLLSSFIMTHELLPSDRATLVVIGGHLATKEAGDGHSNHSTWRSVGVVPSVQDKHSHAFSFVEVRR